MDKQRDLRNKAWAIVDANRYMTLGTVGDNGEPWASPVYYASRDYKEFYWVSSPEVTHSRNIARRPRLSIVIFDSQQPPGTGLALYMSAEAYELADADLERGLEIYPGRMETGARTFTADEVQAPAPYRLYRATASEYSMLCPRETGQPCGDHGRTFDHRTTVTL